MCKKYETSPLIVKRINILSVVILTLFFLLIFELVKFSLNRVIERYYRYEVNSTVC